MKLKKSSVAAVEQEVKPAATGGAFISARLRNPADELAGADKPRKSGGDLLSGICAIIATVLIAVVTALLYFNWDAIKSA